MIRVLESVDRDGTFSLRELLSSGAVDDVVPLFDFETSGWSMYPTLKNGDRIELAPVQRPDAGDIIVFRDRAALICHRVVAVDDAGRARTQGDSGVESEPGDGVPIEDVVGRVAAVVRGTRRFVPSRVARHPGAIGRAWLTVNCRTERFAGVARAAMINLVMAAARHVWFRTLASRVLARRVTLSTAVKRFGHPDLLLVARLAGRCVGTLDRASGECWVHPCFHELGIREMLVRGGSR